jgi:hypothetical protein
VAEEHNSAHLISLFRFRMRDRILQRQEYSSTAERLPTLASAIPDFVSFRYYTSDDGELLAVTRGRNRLVLLPHGGRPFIWRTA